MHVLHILLVSFLSAHLCSVVCWQLEHVVQGKPSAGHNVQVDDATSALY